MLLTYNGNLSNTVRSISGNRLRTKNVCYGRGEQARHSGLDGF